MSDQSAQMVNILSDMRDLLRLMAEPAMAARDKKLRAALREIAGVATGKKAQAILLMDGVRGQKDIVRECGIDIGTMSRLVTKLQESNLLSGATKGLQLAISIPSDFFERDDSGDNS